MQAEGDKGGKDLSTCVKGYEVALLSGCASKINQKKNACPRKPKCFKVFFGAITEEKTWEGLCEEVYLCFFGGKVGENCPLGVA